MGKFTLGALAGFTAAVVLAPVAARYLRIAANRLEDLDDAGRR